MSALTDAAVWTDLVHRRDADRATTLRDRFATDPDRATSLGFTVGDLWIDVSKQPIDTDLVDGLFRLADQRGVHDLLTDMMGGGAVNPTEGRPALHTALRAPVGSVIEVGGADVVAGVHATLDRMAALADDLRAGRLVGATGHTIRAVVSLGIGGSHLGPAMAAEALADLAHPDIEVRWSSNLDGADVATALDGLDPAATLVVVCSKSFTTVETMTAAATAGAWLQASVGDDVSAHLVAATAAPDRAVAAGFDPAAVFTFPEWVGGRFSLPSAVSLGLMVAIGPAAFGEMLAGMHTVDRHVGDDPRSGPLLLGLLDVWHRSALGAGSLAVVPYSHRLRRFPEHLSQVMMESLGKRVRFDGGEVDGPTGTVVWGAPGTDGQHAFFQLLHQGTDVVPVDLIGVARPGVDPRDAHHDALIANLLAQAEALAFGRTADEVAATGCPPELVPHRTFPGDRPSTVILAPELSPSTLGQLVALYEHRTVAAAAVWGINPFDQWGVELGKQLAVRLTEELRADADGAPPAHDASTNALIARYRAWRGRD